LLILALIAPIAACGKIIPDIPDMVVTQQRVEEAERLLESDPLGPIPRPDMPGGSGGERSIAPAPSGAAEKIAYEVEVVAPDSPEGLADRFREASDLFAMKDRPPTSELTLTRRLHSSIDQGIALLRSLGYYEGRVEGAMSRVDGKRLITMRLEPGPLYHLEAGRVEILTGDEAIGLSGGEDEVPDQPVAQELRETWPAPCPVDPCPADTLAQAGLVPGAPARADDVLAAVDALAAIWRDGGYPKAEVAATRYSVDREARTLLAEVALKPGPHATMGDIARQTSSEVKDGWLDYQINWRRGQHWSQSLAEGYRETLMRSGLFKAVEIAPGLGPNDPDPVLLTLEDAPARTVSGSLNYDTDFGPGVEVAWEHRNLTGWGDKLRIEAPVWRDLIQLAASYQRPYFLSRRQSLLLEASLLKEDAEAYDLRSASLAAGIDRQLTPKIRGIFRTSLETGSLEEELRPREDYLVLGLPVTLEWSDADSFLDPTKGARVSLLVAPYYGRYHSDFSVVKSRLDAAYYRPLMGPDKLILALRAAVGAINGSGPSALPSSLRFFGGGGKSIRGYDYQSIGPKNARGRPIGGAAVVETGLEARYRWSKTMGITAFIDGGNVYERPKIDHVGQDLLWGGGLGFRYYSPVGPFRLDVATPLTPRDDDDPIQIYLSLGQSF
jgi:translocation and assembly module TamA